MKICKFAASFLTYFFSTIFIFISRHRHLRFFGYIARADPSQDHRRALRVYQPSPGGLAAPKRSTQADLASYRRTQPPTTQPGPQLGVEAGTGPFKMASTCGDGYAH